MGSRCSRGQSVRVFSLHFITVGLLEIEPFLDGMAAGHLGESTGILFADSFPIRICKNKLIRQNMVLKDVLNIGDSAMAGFMS